ncbi:hypothetical protein TB2_014252 [Malus domestica]
MKDQKIQTNLEIRKLGPPNPTQTCSSSFPSVVGTPISRRSRKHQTKTIARDTGPSSIVYMSDGYQVVRQGRRRERAKVRLDEEQDAVATIDVRRCEGANERLMCEGAKVRRRREMTGLEGGLAVLSESEGLTKTC